MDERRYDEREAAEILRRAVATHGQRVEGGVDGLSLADLQRVAGEVGIDPAEVARAASEVEAGNARPGFKGSSAVHHERVFDHEIDADTFDACLSEVRHATGSAGEITRDGERWTYWGASAMSRTRLEAVVRGGKTRLVLHTNLMEGVAMSYFVPGLISFLSVMVISKKLWDAGWVTALIAMIATVVVLMGTGVALSLITASKTRARNSKLMTAFGRIIKPTLRDNLNAPVTASSTSETVSEPVTE